MIKDLSRAALNTNYMNVLHGVKRLLNIPAFVSVLTFFSFEGETYASHIRMNGNLSVKADSINHILQGRKATYIRYDVEGSKLEALKGSIKTIQKYRPKLAILLYHKPEDVAEIPNFLEDFIIINKTIPDKNARNDLICALMKV